MPEFTARIVARAAITAVDEAAAGEVADELAKELAALAADMPIYETVVESVDPEDHDMLIAEPEAGAGPAVAKAADFKPSFWKIGAWVLGLWWFGNGMLVQASLAQDKTYSVNPLTHTVTIQSSDEMPKDGAGAIGYALGLTVARPSCEATAANLIGFGWGVTVLAKDGMLLMSCWSWQ